MGHGILTTRLLTLREMKSTKLRESRGTWNISPLICKRSALIGRISPGTVQGASWLLLSGCTLLIWTSHSTGFSQTPQQTRSLMIKAEVMKPRLRDSANPGQRETTQPTAAVHVPSRQHPKPAFGAFIS